METTYSWLDSGGATLMVLRNLGEQAAFAGITAPVMAGAIRRANGKDLARLRTSPARLAHGGDSEPSRVPDGPPLGCVAHDQRP